MYWYSLRLPGQSRCVELRLVGKLTCGGYMYSLTAADLTPSWHVDLRCYDTGIPAYMSQGHASRALPRIPGDRPVLLPRCGHQPEGQDGPRWDGRPGGGGERQASQFGECDPLALPPPPGLRGRCLSRVPSGISHASRFSKKKTAVQALLAHEYYCMHSAHVCTHTRTGCNLTKNNLPQSMVPGNKSTKVGKPRGLVAPPLKSTYHTHHPWYMI